MKRQQRSVYATGPAICIGLACLFVPLRQAIGTGVDSADGAVVTNSLTLHAATEWALKNNSDLAARSADVRGAKERARAVGARRWPTVSISGSYQEYLDDIRLTPASYNGEQGTFSSDFAEGGLIIKTPLYTGGKLTADIRAADLIAQSADGLLSRSRRELTFNVRSIFYAMLTQEHLVESVEFSVKAIDEHLKRVNEMVEAQKAARVDALRTEVRRAELMQRLITTRNTLAIQKRVLANLLGVESSALPPIDGKLKLEEPVLCPKLGDCLATAWKQRTDAQAALLWSRAAEAVVRSARGDRLPQFSLTGSYGYRWSLDPSDQPDGTEDGEELGRIGIVVELPLFEGGRLSAKVAETKAALTAAHERERSLQLRIQREVEIARLSVSAARQRIDVAKVAMTQAEESLRIEREKYELGKGAIVDVLDAQAALLQSQTSNYRALADLNVSIGELDLAMGKETSE